MINKIKLKDIYAEYNSSRFFLDIPELEFSNKHIHIIAGPNGCGKTTLLNLVALLNKPDRGRVIFDGEGVDYKGALRKKIGFVTQNPYLFNMSVFENTALGLKIRKCPPDKIISKVDGILEILKIRHLAQRNVNCLSRGEYRKTAIAQVLALEPEVIIMDEPTANIDRHSTLLIEEMVRNIQGRLNPVIVMTTHSLNQAYRLSKSEIISLGAGKVVDFIHENVFFGCIENFAQGLQCMQVAPGMKIVLSSQKKGDNHIVIEPENIIISKSIVSTSARNVFKGKIKKIESLAANVRLLVDVGIDIYALITRRSFDEMGINLGSRVYVSFKVNSVRVI